MNKSSLDLHSQDKSKVGMQFVFILVLTIPIFWVTQTRFMKELATLGEETFKEEIPLEETGMWEPMMAGVYNDYIKDIEKDVVANLVKNEENNNAGVLLKKLKTISEDEVVADPVKFEKSNTGALLDEVKTGISEVDDDDLVAERIMEEFSDQEKQLRNLVAKIGEEIAKVENEMDSK